MLSQRAIKPKTTNQPIIHRPDMSEMLLRRTLNRSSAIHPSFSALMVINIIPFSTEIVEPNLTSNTSETKIDGRSQSESMLTHYILVDSSTVICWSICHLWVSGLFSRFYSIFDGRYCKETM